MCLYDLFLHRHTPLFLHQDLAHDPTFVLSKQEYEKESQRDVGIDNTDRDSTREHKEANEESMVR